MLGLLHVALAGIYYIENFVPKDKEGTAFVDLALSLAPFWFLVWFVWDTLPLVIVVKKIVEKGDCISVLEFLNRVLHYDKLFLMTLLGHILVISFYYIISLLMYYTSVLKDDRTWLA